MEALNNERKSRYSQVLMFEGRGKVGVSTKGKCNYDIETDEANIG